MKKQKIWLGSFEEQLYEEFTSSVKVHNNHLLINKRKCLRCDNIFRSKEQRICERCTQTNKYQGENDA